jgi:hypothetical protein
VATADPEVLARYRAEGFQHVLLWADQVWPRDRDDDDKRRALVSAAEALGVCPS